MNEITQLLHIDPLLLQALREDIPEEDVSTNAVMPHACPGTVDLIAKEDGIVAGLAVYARVFTLLGPRRKVEFFLPGRRYRTARAKSWPLLRAIYAPCFPVSALR